MIVHRSPQRWLYLILGMITLLFSGLIYGWSLFSGYYAELYPSWSLRQLSLTFTISMICFCIGGLLSGRLAARVPLSRILALAALLALAGFFGVSRMDPGNPSGSLMALYLSYGVSASLGIGITFNSILSSVGRWFPDRPGLSTGLMMMGFGCGALILGGAATGIIDRAGLNRAFLILGAGTAAVTLIAAAVIRLPDPEVSADAGMAGSPEVDGALTGKTSAEMLRTGTFWLFLLWAVTVNIAGLMIIGNAAPIALSEGAPAIVGMVVSVCNGLGRILLGALFDASGRIRTMGTNLALLLIAGTLLTAGTALHTAPVLIAGLMVMGVEYGGNPTICSSFVREQFGERCYASNFAIINCSIIPAAIIGPTLSSRLVEASGSYLTSFLTVILCGVIAVILFAILNRAGRKS